MLPIFSMTFSDVPKSESKGLEFELKWAPTHELFFAGSVGILDTEVDRGKRSAFRRAGS